MPQALTKVYTHLIFSTKKRKKLIDKPIEADLSYMFSDLTEWSGAFPDLLSESRPDGRP